MAILQSTTVANTGTLLLPKGTTAQRPGSPTAGMVRFNTDLNYSETYTGTAWVAFCTGSGVEQDQTYTDIIEKKINIRSLNAGISSFGTIREGLMLKSLDRDSLKLVILQLYHYRWVVRLLAFILSLRKNSSRTTLLLF
jgi:hypothetical protein